MSDIEVHILNYRRLHMGLCSDVAYVCLGMQPKPLQVTTTHLTKEHWRQASLKRNDPSKCILPCRSWIEELHTTAGQVVIEQPLPTHFNPAIQTTTRIKAFDDSLVCLKKWKVTVMQWRMSPYGMVEAYYSQSVASIDSFHLKQSDSHSHTVRKQHFTASESPH